MGTEIVRDDHVGALQGAAARPPYARLRLVHALALTLSLAAVPALAVPRQLYLDTFDTFPNGGSFINVTILNAITGGVIATVSHSGGGAFAADPIRQRVYVVGAGVSVIDSSTGRLLRKLTYPGNVTGVAISPDGSRLYIAFFGTDNEIVAVDPSTFAPVAHVRFDPAQDVLVSPYSVAVDPGGSRVYIAAQGRDGGILVYDRGLTTLLARTPLGSLTPATYVTIDPAGLRLYVPQASNIAVLDAATTNLVGTIQASARVVVNPDGATAYVSGSANGDAAVLTIDTTTDTVTGSILPGAVSFALDPDGRYVFGHLPAGDHVEVLDLATSQTIVFPDSYPDTRSVLGVTRGTPCGDGVVDAGEACDDGNATNFDSCDNNCTPPGCGNGIIDPGEACDDANLIDGDGCSSACQDEILDVSGSWQITETAGGVTATEFVVLTEDQGTGAIQASQGFSCGTNSTSGEIHNVTNCIMSPALVDGVVQGTTLSLPATGAFNSEGTISGFFDFAGCHPISRVNADHVVLGSMVASGGRATRITGTLLLQNLKVYDLTDTVCLSLAQVGLQFVMLRNDVALGANVGVEPLDNATVTFSSVQGAGAAGVVNISDATATLPTNFRLSDNATYSDVVTNASINGPIMTCLPYADDDGDGFVDGTTPRMPEDQLQILHAEDGVFVDRTVSRDPVNNVICAQTSSLSEFAVGVAAPTTTTTSTTSTTTSTTLPAGCDMAPRTTCKTANAFGSKVAAKALAPEGADKISWKWKGQATTLSDFGNPLGTTGYALCIYEGSTLHLTARAPASGICGAKPCWKALGSKGYGYKDAASTPDGLLKVTLRMGVAGKAQVAVKGKGVNPPDGVLPLSTPVTVQLQATTGACWTATFGTATASDAGQFKATSD